MIPSPSFHTWLDRYGHDIEALCLDIDGVLLNAGHRLPGSRRLLEMLRKKSLAFVLLTNDGNHSPLEKIEALHRAGLSIDPSRLVSCGHAIKPMVAAMELTGKPFFAMGDTGRPCYAQDAGLWVTRDLDRLPDCRGVIIGEEHYDWEPVINSVINYFIDRPQAPLIVPNPDEFYPARKLKIHIAAGGVGRFVQQVLKTYGVEINPIYLGKPYPPIFDLARVQLETQVGHSIAPQNIIVAGDNMAADIAGGRRMGYRTALLLTGVTSLDAFSKSTLTPDMVFNAL